MKKQFLNQLINSIWTILCFTPVVLFWIFIGLDRWFYIFLILSFAAGFLPSGLFQLSNSPKFYEKLGARWIRKFVQNGDLVNRLFQRENTLDKIIKNKNYAERYLKTILMYEKYHVICLVFFCFSAFFSVNKQDFLYFALIVISNIFYNIYPVILQQYNRARILGLTK